MVFGAFLWILIIASIPLLTSPEFGKFNRFLPKQYVRK